jgi:anion-transporting  ArsA/GET3 family ATPase
VRKVLLFCAGLLLCGVSCAEARPGHEVKDLHYGDVLFYFYQDDFFEAITRLTAAWQLGYSKAHTEDSDLLLGGMLLSYGQQRQASAIFQRLLDNNVKPEVRDRAWFYLARVSFDRGETDQAATALSRIQGKLPPRMDDERRMLQAQVLMEQGHNQEAATLLSGWKGDADWNGYVRYNLGVALVRAQHPDEGFKLLEQAGQMAAKDPEQMALRDRANLALGFAEIQAQKPEAARAALQRVRLEGPYSNKALLGLGWADTELDQDKEALVPWTELGKRDLLDPAVEESLLALPYAMARLHAYSAAAAHYQSAIKAFDEESARLDSAIASIRSGQMLQALLKDEEPEQLNWGWQLDHVPPGPDSRYLVQVLASKHFQEALKDYRDLRFIHRNLTDWSQSVAAYSDMLTTGRLAYQQRLPHLQQTLQRVDLNALQQRQAALQQRLDKIDSSQDVLGLANAKELQQLATLNEVEARAAKLGNTSEAAELRDRVRILRGLLRWDLEHDYKLRLYREKRALADLGQAMDAAKAAHQAVDQAQTNEPERLGGFAQRVNQQPPRIAALLARTDALLARHQAYLQELAAGELEQQKARLQDYAVEARYALAQVYDHAAQAPSTAPVPAPGVKQ